MNRVISSRGASAAVAAGLALLAAGGGYALASGGGTVKACVTKGTHVLYTGKCHKGDSKISWSKVGPQGKQGTQGPQGGQGPQGNPGPQGPSAGFSNSDNSILYGSTTKTIVTLSLPPGKYLVMFKGVPYVASGTDTQRCDLLDPSSSSLDTAFVTLDATSSGFADTTETMVSPLTLSSAGTISVTCTDSANAGEMFNNRLTAVQLGSVTGTSGTVSGKGTSPAG